jgi:hypothetical protein
VAKKATAAIDVETQPDPILDSVSWIDADKEYALGIDDGKLVCRSPKEKKLASVPKWLKETDLAEQLLATCEWLAAHRVDCLRRVETWMLRSLPVPIDVLLSVWADPDWRAMLQNLVVAPLSTKNELNAEKTGLLRDIQPNKGIGVVDRDGETQWIKAAQIMIPHPILIEGLDDLREIAADMSFAQSVEQLFRPVYAATEEQQNESQVTEFSGGKFAQLNFATSLCRRFGYPVRGGYACSKMWENTTTTEARFWVGDDYPEGETWTGDLIFVDDEQVPLKIAKIGRVTFSEGMRMASQIFAKRQVEDTEGENE